MTGDAMPPSRVHRRAGRIGGRVAERFEVTGIVQGVGFRPFVYRLATELGLDGEVGNDSTQVFIDVAGPPAALDELARRLVAEQPPLARIERVTRTPAARPVGGGFRIVESHAVAGARTLVPPDTAVCDDCVAELFDPADRRYRHPFITCTNCGPRFTIIRDLPYDRPATTMAAFPMCEECAAEYGDPADRRYHAQPIACHRCGPRLVFVAASGDAPSVGDVALGRAIDALRAGLTVAIKGLGGYHLACDATSSDAITRLRDRKHRPDKPFAIMMRDLDAVRAVAEVGEVEAAELCSPARPVVLLRARTDSTVLSPLVAPANPLVGVMLPHTPVQHLLLSDAMPPLVMTSGNVSGEPIAYRDDDARARLAPLCDAFLGHDRPIHVPCDDSVVRVVDGELLPIRRARGFAPVPIALAGARQHPVLAVGGELKNTFCLASIDHAWVSQHIGDMENLETLTAFEASVEQFRGLYALTPRVVAVDAHPGYATTRWARQLAAADPAVRVVAVQHHHAHVAAVLAEHGCAPTERVLGVAFDGTGYGTDGAIWGGEVLVADACGFERRHHLAEVPLPGGDAAIRSPAGVALAHLAAAGIAWDDDLPPVVQLDDVERGVLRRQLETGFACVPTTSMGRLFDAIASIVGLRHRISFEAQAAIDLELAAERAGRADRGYRFGIDGEIVDHAGVVRAVVEDLRGAVPVGVIAACFHAAVVELVAELVERAGDELGLHRVALTGGVFQNALLVAMCRERLSGLGVEVLTHRLVPPNDGGLALGQAFVAAHAPGAGELDGVAPPRPHQEDA
jgi:hydrogenase maturation protein HypF